MIFPTVGHPFHHCASEGGLDPTSFFFWLLWVFVVACRLSLVWGERWLHFVAVRGLLLVLISLVDEHWTLGMRAH